MIRKRDKLVTVLNDHTCLTGDSCKEECNACLADHLIAQGVEIPVRCGKCQHLIRNVENRKDYGTCFVAGFAHGAERPENGYCERGVEK